MKARFIAILAIGGAYTILGLGTTELCADFVSCFAQANMGGGVSVFETDCFPVAFSSTNDAKDEVGAALSGNCTYTNATFRGIRPNDPLIDDCNK